MSIPKEQLIQETRTLIQFALTVAIFFSSFLMAIAPGTTTAIFWGIAVALHLSNYLLIDLIGSKIRNGWYRWLKASLYLGVAVSVPPIMLISIYGNKPVPRSIGIALVVFLWAVLLMPVLTLYMIAGHFDWLEIRKVYRLFWKRKKKARRSVLTPSPQS